MDGPIGLLYLRYAAARSSVMATKEEEVGAEGTVESTPNAKREKAKVQKEFEADEILLCAIAIHYKGKPIPPEVADYLASMEKKVSAIEQKNYPKLVSNMPAIFSPAKYFKSLDLENYEQLNRVIPNLFVLLDNENFKNMGRGGGTNISDDDAIIMAVNKLEILGNTNSPQSREQKLKNGVKNLEILATRIFGDRVTNALEYGSRVLNEFQNFQSTPFEEYVESLEIAMKAVKLRFGTDNSYSAFGYLVKLKEIVKLDSPGIDDGENLKMSLKLLNNLNKESIEFIKTHSAEEFVKSDLYYNHKMSLIPSTTKTTPPPSPPPTRPDRIPSDSSSPSQKYASAKLPTELLVDAKNRSRRGTSSPPPIDVPAVTETANGPLKSSAVEQTIYKGKQ